MYDKGGKGTIKLSCWICICNGYFHIILSYTYNPVIAMYKITYSFLEIEH